MTSHIYDFLKFTFNKSNYIVSKAKIALLEVNGGQIEYCRFGVGSPLVLIIGYAGTMNAWDLRFLNELAQKHEVILFNNRNTGNSNFDAKDYTAEDMANDVELLRSGLNLDKISVCGLSLGGVIAQQYAFLYPTNLKNMILINSLPPGNLIFMPGEKVEKTLRDLPNGNFVTYWNMLKLLFPSVWQATALGAFHFRPDGGKNIVSSQTLIEQQIILERWSVYPNPEDLLTNIKTPTLILVGEADQLLPSENSYVIKKYLVNSDLVNIKDGGHIMIYQKPIELATAISNFLT